MPDIGLARIQIATIDVSPKHCSAVRVDIEVGDEGGVEEERCKMEQKSCLKQSPQIASDLLYICILLAIQV